MRSKMQVTSRLLIALAAVSLAPSFAHTCTGTENQQARPELAFDLQLPPQQRACRPMRLLLAEWRQRLTGLTYQKQRPRHCRRSHIHNSFRHFPKSL